MKVRRSTQMPGLQILVMIIMVTKWMYCIDKKDGVDKGGVGVGDKSVVMTKGRGWF